MAITSLKIKIMPEQDIDLEKLKENIADSLKKAGAVSSSIEVEEIAFGLKALIITIAWPESLDTEIAEKSCKIEGVSSIQVVDYRRAFG